MRRHIRLISVFIVASVQQEAAYRANFLISITHSLLNLGTGVLGVAVLFSQVDTIHGWDHASTLAVLGVYMTVGALRDLVISPSLDALAGMDGEVWRGEFDFTLLRPVDTQFLASVRHWRPLALFDLLLGASVLIAAVVGLGQTLTLLRMLAFLVTLSAGTAVVYAILLALTGLVFWSPGFLFTWIFGGVFQMARYPVGVYPGWLRLALTWVVPVGVITTIPAQALTGELSPGMFAGVIGFTTAIVAGASMLFRTGLHRYASASS